MSKALDIKRIGGMLLILLAALFLLSACSNDPDEQQNRAISGAQATTAANADAPKIDCWQGDVLNTIYDVIGATIMKQYDNLCKGSLSLMMISFAVWVALRLLKFVSSVTESSPAEIWNEIVHKAFICLFCAYLAYSSGTLLYVINFFLFPIYGAFLELGSMILAETQKQVESVVVFGEKVEFVIKDMACTVGDKTEATLSGFPPAYKETMSCMICVLVDKLRMGRQMALTAMSMSGFLPWITGLLVFTIFYVVGFAFVFYLVDSVFRFGMMILLLPIFIMAYAFGPTRKWTGIGFNNIMHSAAFMMAFSIIIATVLMAMIELISDPATGGIFNPEDPEQHFKQISVATLCLLLVGFLVWGSMKVSQSLTGAIVGGGSESKFQQNLKAVAQMGLHLLTGGFGWMLNHSGFYEKTRTGRWLKQGGAIRDKINRMAGRNVTGK